MRARMFLKIAVIPLVLLAASLAACGGAHTVNNFITCPTISLQPPTLVNPAPNATNVPDAIDGIEVEYSGDISSWSTPVLTPSGGGSNVDGGPFTIVPTPGPILYSSKIPTLKSATTYSVVLTTPASGGFCSQNDTLGSFTTQ
jgi:hypothetical protein